MTFHSLHSPMGDRRTHSTRKEDTMMEVWNRPVLSLYVRFHPREEKRNSPCPVPQLLPLILNSAFSGGSIMETKHFGFWKIQSAGFPVRNKTPVSSFLAVGQDLCSRAEVVRKERPVPHTGSQQGPGTLCVSTSTRMLQLCRADACLCVSHGPAEIMPRIFTS